MTSQKQKTITSFLPLGPLGKLLSAKVNLIYLFYSMAWRCYLLHLINQNCLLKYFLGTLILMIQVSFYLFSLLELIWSSVIIMSLPSWIQKATTNLDLSKVSGPVYIPVVVLKNCEPELSYILAELFNIFLKESCSPDCLKV